MKLRYVNGVAEQFAPSPQSYEFHPCQIEPDQSLTIRQIYTRWRKNMPTTIHPFACDFDEDADDIDFESENPIDMCQIENRVQNLQNELDTEREEKKSERKRKKAERDAKMAEIKALADAINKKE